MTRNCAWGMVAALLCAAACGCGADGDKVPEEGVKPPAQPAPSATPAPAPLLVHIGGTMKPAMSEICRLFEQETGRRVEVNFEDSGSLMIKLEQTGKGDLLVVHDPFPAKLEKDGFVDRSHTVAVLYPVIAVKKGNPKKIAGIKDLARADVKVGLTDAVYSTAGHIVTKMFGKAGIAEAMAGKAIPRTRAGGESANAVKIGTIDATIVWDAVAFARRADLDAVEIEPAFRPHPVADAVTGATYGRMDLSATKVVVMTLRKADDIEGARKLAELAASERGRAIWARHGFSPAPVAK